MTSYKGLFENRKSYWLVLFSIVAKIDLSGIRENAKVDRACTNLNTTQSQLKRLNKEMSSLKHERYLCLTYFCVVFCSLYDMVLCFVEDISLLTQ